MLHTIPMPTFIESVACNLDEEIQRISVIIMLHYFKAYHG